MRMTRNLFQQLNRNSAVKAACAAKAARLAARAQQITASDGGEAKITVESGIRPKGRAFTNVVSDSRDEEYGTQSTPRIRALGRAAREV